MFQHPALLDLLELLAQPIFKLSKIKSLKPHQICQRRKSLLKKEDTYIIGLPDEQLLLQDFDLFF